MPSLEVVYQLYFDSVLLNASSTEGSTIVTNFSSYSVSDLWTISSNMSERAIISVPTNPWEKTPYGRTVNVRRSSNEGPKQLTNPTINQTFVIYSAACSDNCNYCFGQLELVGADPMNAQHWRKNNEGCVFHQNVLDQTYGVGHASSTTSPDGTENWIVYHGMCDPVIGWAARSVRTQQLGWNDDGSPAFPRPSYRPYPVPSSQGNLTQAMRRPRGMSL